MAARRFWEIRPFELGAFGLVTGLWLLALFAVIGALIHDGDHRGEQLSAFGQQFSGKSGDGIPLHLALVGMLVVLLVGKPRERGMAVAMAIVPVVMLALMIALHVSDFGRVLVPARGFVEPHPLVVRCVIACLALTVVCAILHWVLASDLVLGLFATAPIVYVAALAWVWHGILVDWGTQDLPLMYPSPMVAAGVIAGYVACGAIGAVAGPRCGMISNWRTALLLAGSGGLALTFLGLLAVMIPQHHKCMHSGRSGRLLAYSNLLFLAVECGLAALLWRRRRRILGKMALNGADPGRGSAV